MWHLEFATRYVIQIDGLAFGSSPITRARGAQAVMAQSFRPLNIEGRTLLARGEETTTPKAARASNFMSHEYMYIKENTKFSTD
jgi:hypothetical protein